MASKDQIIAKMQDLQGQIERVVADMPDDAWSKGVYEGGWDAQQILAHIASVSGPAGFILNLAKAPAATTPQTAAGWSMAMRSAFTAPIEWPTTTTGGSFSVATNAAASAAKSRVR